MNHIDQIEIRGLAAAVAQQEYDRTKAARVAASEAEEMAFDAWQDALKALNQSVNAFVLSRLSSIGTPPNQEK